MAHRSSSALARRDGPPRGISFCLGADASLPPCEPRTVPLPPARRPRRRPRTASCLVASRSWQHVSPSLPLPLSPSPSLSLFLSFSRSRLPVAVVLFLSSHPVTSAVSSIHEFSTISLTRRLYSRRFSE